MPFLALNGITIPTRGESSAAYDHNEIGQRTRSAAGGLHTDVRARKRVWHLGTPPLSAERAATVRGLLQGNGSVFPFDGSWASSSFLAATVSSSQLRAAATDGNVVRDENGTNEILYGTGCGIFEPTAVLPNLLSTADATHSTKWTAVGGTTVLDSSNILYTANSTRWGASGAGQYAVNNTAYVAAANTTYTATVYFRPNVSGLGQSGTLTVFNNTTALSAGSTTVASATGIWRRVSVTFTTAAAPGAQSLNLRWSNSSSSAVDILACAQLEASAFPTAWITPASSKPAGLTQYAQPVSGVDGFTFASWFSQPPQIGSNCTLWSITNSAQTLAGVWLTYLSAGTLTLSVTTSSGVVTAVANGLTVSGWNHVTVVGRRNPTGTQASVTVYFNGVSVATSAGVFDTTLMQSFSLGNLLNASEWLRARLDDVVVLPFPVDATWPASVTAAGAAYGASSPYSVATGSFIDETSVVVDGVVDKETFIGAQGVAAFEANQRIVDFTLTEA